MTQNVETPITQDDEPVQPRPRTMRMKTGDSVTPEQAEAFVGGVAEGYGVPAPQVNTDDEYPGEYDDEDDEGEARLPAEPIHAGWTAGQNVMDSTSGFASALQLTQDVVIIKFMDDQPYANFRRHWIDRVGPQGVKKRPYTCLETIGKDCPLCNIADKPQAVSAFSVVLVGDDGQVVKKTWDVGARLFGVLKAYAQDPKVGPLTRGYFAVNKTGKAGNQQTNVTPIRPNRLQEDYDIAPPTPEMLEKAGRYDASVVVIPKKSDLEEIAQEIAEND